MIKLIYPFVFNIYFVRRSVDISNTTTEKAKVSSYIWRTNKRSKITFRKRDREKKYKR